MSVQKVDREARASVNDAIRRKGVAVMKCNAYIGMVLAGLFLASVAIAQDSTGPFVKEDQGIQELREEIRGLRGQVQQLERLNGQVRGEIDSKLESVRTVRELDEEVADNSRQLADYKVWGAVFMAVVSIFSAVVYRRLNKLVEEAVERDLIEKTRGPILEDVDRRFSASNLHLIDLIALVSRAEEGLHDEAIGAISWDKKFSSLQEYPVEIRKRIIRSVLLGGSDLKKYREDVWRSAEIIFNENRSESNVAFLYELASSVRDWRRGLGFYERYGKDVPISSDPEGFFALTRILRRTSSFDQILEVEEKFGGIETLKVVRYLGHTYNNLGAFEEADRRFMPKIQEIIDGGPGSVPSDWVAVTYCFLLNCIEWGKPERGLAAARLAVRMRGDSLLQLGVLRLALQLEERGGSEVEAEALVEGVRENLANLPMDSARLQTHARLMAHDEGGVKGAKAAAEFLDKRKAWALSRKTIEYLENGAGKDSCGKAEMELPRAEYFYVCLIGEMKIRAGHHEQARELLHKVSLNDPVGEASFLIALSHSEQNYDGEAIRHLERAGLAHRRWCRIAELYPTLMESHNRRGSTPCVGIPDPLRTTGGREGEETSAEAP